MKIRPMTMVDAPDMLEWKNYPETRQFAIASKKEVKEVDHIKWLKDNVQYFQIITDQMGTKYGAIRSQDKEISIWVNREFWGKGIAPYAIKRVAWGSGYTAKIVDGNIASMRAFIKAGFMPFSYHHENSTNYYLFKK